MYRVAPHTWRRGKRTEKEAESAHLSSPLAGCDDVYLRSCVAEPSRSLLMLNHVYQATGHCGCLAISPPK
ncbi:hypothetical protein HYQ46_000787 [Verticillium longisporum]|nr:hypothetical protein HYQ46_000787 [Verticillium longisporum]